MLTMSFAPRDTHVSQIQFALERGVPAILGIMAENRMPYPARSFDMAHCSRCLIPWAKYGNVTTPLVPEDSCESLDSLLNSIPRFVQLSKSSENTEAPLKWQAA